MYNNSMINFNPLPGHPNSIAPGKGRITGMTPTIVAASGSVSEVWRGGSMSELETFLKTQLLLRFAMRKGRGISFRAVSRCGKWLRS
jgi:gamma-glutamyltranspeptidase